MPRGDSPWVKPAAGQEGCGFPSSTPVPSGTPGAASALSPLPHQPSPDSSLGQTWRRWVYFHTKPFPEGSVLRGEDPS